MYRLLALVLSAVIALPAPTLLAAGAGGSTVSGATGQISGRAFDLMGRQLGPVTVRPRNLSTFDGALAGTTRSGAAGDFSFSGLRAGNYVVEVGNAAGQVIGISRVIPMTAGQMIAGGIGIAVAAESESAAAGSGAFTPGSFLTPLGLSIIIGGAAALVAWGIHEHNKTASSSR